jgi:hypothetical protein
MRQPKNALKNTTFLISQRRCPVSSSADARRRSAARCETTTGEAEPPAGGNAKYLAARRLERIRYSNQSVTPAPLRVRMSAVGGSLVTRRMMSRPVVMCVMTMMLVMRRRRKACARKQEQRYRDSNDDLTHDSTLVFDELLSGRLA